MKELEKSMYYGALPETFSAAKILRNNMTTCEKLLWEKLKMRLRAESKVPPGGFRGGSWQSLMAATRNPVEALRYE